MLEADILGVKKMNDVKLAYDNARLFARVGVEAEHDWLQQFNDAWEPAGDEAMQALASGDPLVIAECYASGENCCIYTYYGIVHALEHAAAARRTFNLHFEHFIAKCLCHGISAKTAECYAIKHAKF
jgi:hypothetical protein